MQPLNRKALGLAALVAFAPACSDDPAGPEAAGSLSDIELGIVVVQVADAADGVLDGEIAARPSILPAGEGGVALSMVPVEEEFEFSRGHDCREGGSVTVSGSGLWVGDRETGVVTIDIEGEKVIDDCARVRGDVVITFNGGGSVEGHRMKVNGQYSGLQTHDQEGAFSWETSDGRSGECRYELHVEWNPETHVKTVTGFVCEREIDREVTRDRAAGDHAGDG
ncbi:MAG: hypothetical protein R3195_12030 [Gemmatimonadota bacterium]|nr:hypothetical protein [Gemmatimonadota bacterium]